MMTRVNQINSNLRMATKARRSHSTGVIYRTVQNILLSTSLTGFSESADSNTHMLAPSLPVSENQRNPTSSRPDTFFTVQKSNARSKTMMTKIRTKLEVKRRPSKYVKIAENRKTSRQNSAIGCDESWNI